MCSSFHIDCTWKTLDNSNLSQLISFRSDDESLTELQTQTTQPSCTVTLVPQNTEVQSACEITITRNNTYPALLIEAIDVLCDARYMELHSHDSGEYVKTCQGERVDQELEYDRPLYMLQNLFEIQVTGCKLRMVSLVNAESLWIHSIHVTVSRDLAPPPGSSMTHPLSRLTGVMGGPVFNMEKVREIMNETGASVPQQAVPLFAAMERKTRERQQQQKFLDMMSAFITQPGHSDPVNADTSNEITSSSSDVDREPNFSMMSNMMTMFANMRTNPTETMNVATVNSSEDSMMSNLGDDDRKANHHSTNVVKDNDARTKESAECCSNSSDNNAQNLKNNSDTRSEDCNNIQTYNVESTSNSSHFNQTTTTNIENKSVENMSDCNSRNTKSCKAPVQKVVDNFANSFVSSGSSGSMEALGLLGLISGIESRILGRIQRMEEGLREDMRQSEERINNRIDILTKQFVKLSNSDRHIDAGECNKVTDEIQCNNIVLD